MKNKKSSAKSCNGPARRQEPISFSWSINRKEQSLAPLAQPAGCSWGPCDAPRSLTQIEQG